MSDITISGFLSLFALFGKEEQVDETWARTMLANYLRHYFGIRNVDSYLDLYSDMRGAYEMTADVDTKAVVKSICASLHGNVSTKDESLLLLRLMEFCGYAESQSKQMFNAIAEEFHIPATVMNDYADYVANRETAHVIIHHLDDTDGQLKTLFNPDNGELIFTYTGTDQVLLNDVPVLSGAYQVWRSSSVLKGHNGQPVYYSTIVDAHNRKLGREQRETQAVEFCARDVNFRFPNSDNGMHDLSFTLHGSELVAIMGGSGTGKTTLLSLLNGSLTPQSGTITINGHDISEPEAKALIGFVPQDDLLIEELTVYQNLWFTAKLCFDGLSDQELDHRVTKTLKDLGLDAVSHLKVGSPINKFISVFI